jgi:hypothetical protein
MESVDITMDHIGSGVLSESCMRHVLRIVQELWRLRLYPCALVKSVNQVNLSHHLRIRCLLQTANDYHFFMSHIHWERRNYRR